MNGKNDMIVIDAEAQEHPIVELKELKELTFPKDTPTYQQLIQEDPKEVKIEDLKNAIFEIDSRIVSFYHSRHLHISDIDTRNFSVLTEDVRKLVYGKEKHAQQSQELFATALQRLLSLLLDEMGSASEGWLSKESGYDGDIDMEVSILKQFEIDLKKIKKEEASEKLDPIDVQNRILDFSRKLARERRKADVIVHMSNFAAQEEFSMKLRVAKKAVEKVLKPLNRIPSLVYKITAAVSAVVIAGNLYTGHVNKASGYSYTIEELIAQENAASGQGEGERKYQVIEENILPVIAQGIRKLNNDHIAVSYDNFYNDTFFFAEGDAITHPDRKTSNGYTFYIPKVCLTIDASPDYSLGEISIETFYDEEAELNETGEKPVKEHKQTLNCAIDSRKLTELGLGSSIDFIKKIINNPETVRTLVQMAETK